MRHERPAAHWLALHSYSHLLTEAAERKWIRSSVQWNHRINTTPHWPIRLQHLRFINSLKNAHLNLQYDPHPRNLAIALKVPNSGKRFIRSVFLNWWVVECLVIGTTTNVILNVFWCKTSIFRNTFVWFKFLKTWVVGPMDKPVEKPLL